MLHRHGVIAVAALLVAATSACDCNGRDGGTQKTSGELGVVWQDQTGLPMVNRDAVYDFGQAFMGEKVPKKLVLRNLKAGALTLVSLERVDGSAVTIGDAVQPDAAFEVRFKPDSVLPGSEDVELDMFFTPPHAKDPSVEYEPHFVKLTLLVGGGLEDESIATILLKGGASAGSCLIPRELDFGKVLLGERGQLSMDLHNTAQTVALGQVGDPSSTTGDHLAFGFASESPRGQVAISALSAARVTFEFSPTDLRPYQAKVKVKAGPQCGEGEILLKGEGSNESFSWTPAELDFGYVSPNTPGPMAVTFHNPSKSPVKLRNITTSMASDFAVSASAGQDPSLLDVPSGDTTLTVVCRPTTLGGRTASLSFETNLRKQPSGSIPMKCFGGGPNITVTPRPVLSFGRVAFFAQAPATVTRKVTVVNTGTKPPSTASTNVNLKLGQVGQSGPGELPYISVLPLNANTTETEFFVGVPTNYNAAVGLEAAVGRNILDLPVSFTPESEGLKEAELTIYSNDPDEPAVKVRMTADVQNLPPCTYQVEPAHLNFGLMTPPGQKELPVTIRNIGPNVCHLSSIEIAPGSDPAYSVVGGAVAQQELAPGAAMQVVIRSHPVGQVPAGVVSAVGYLQFSASSPTAPTGLVELTTSIGPVCLTIAPDNLDFGTVKKDCSSSSRTFTVYNVCSENVTLTGFQVSVPAGQPAGGPNCPSGGAYCPEFHLVSTPSVGAGLTLKPGDAPVTFQAKYRPIDFGSDSGAIAVNVVQGGQNVTYLVSLKGEGDLIGQQTDTFVQDAKPKADILMVIDNSGSMMDKQTALSNNFAAFMQYATSANVDWRIGVTTSDDEDAYCIAGLPPSVGCKADGEHGRLVSRNGHPKVLSPITPNVGQAFQDNVKVGDQGSGFEVPIHTALKALTPPLVTGDNANFLRDEANLAVVVVTDAMDQSPNPITYYLNRFLNIKGFNQSNMFTFNAIAPFRSAAPSGCTYDDAAPDNGRFTDLVTQTNGIKDEICTSSWSSTLQGLGKTAFGFRTTFFLQSVPDLSGGKTLEVKIDGVPVPSGGGSNWTYDSIANAIKFDVTRTLSPGQSLEVTYFVACL